MKTAKKFDYEKLNGLLNADDRHPHIHNLDMPYRLASIWQDYGCEVGIWEENNQVVAWAIFQPGWWNLDYVIHPSFRGSILEQEIFTWGKDQMKMYSCRTGEEFWGSVEIFEDNPNVSQTIKNLETVGFKPFDWSVFRFELELSQEIQSGQVPKGFTIRPLHGENEIQAYVDLHRAAFGSKVMTTSWRKRILQQPAYQPEIDLIIENEEKMPVGFCICWLKDQVGQIEPLGVHPENQGMGLGKALDAAAYQILKKHGARMIKVDHASDNESAIALSKKTGFQQTHNALRYYVEVKCE